MKSLLSLAIFAGVFWLAKDHAMGIIASMNENPELYTALIITLALKPIVSRFIE
jgi:hypothetical protein